MGMKKSDGVENNRIHIHKEINQVNEFQTKEEKNGNHFSMIFYLFIIWILIYIVSLVCTVQKTQWDFSLAWIINQVSNNIQSLYQFITGSGDSNGMQIRVYQFLIVGITGAALAACGSVFQGAFKNILVGPSTMGVMSGGTLGATIYLFFFTSSTGAVVTTANLDLYHSLTLWQRYEQQFFVLAGCIGTAVLVLTISLIVGKGKISSSAMIMSGMVFSTMISNVAMLFQYYMIVTDPDDPRIEAIRDLLMGSFNQATTISVLLMMGIPIGICCLILIFISGRLNLVIFGEDAITMGINVILYRNIIIVVGTVMTAVVVAFCGHIGFLGFMVPIITRKIAGADMRKLIPASMLTGAIILTLIFDIAYFFGLTDSMNVITSAVGCVVMTIILLRGGGSNRAFE